MNEKRNHKHIQGFTLIELLVVLVILGLLAGLVVPGMLGKAEKAKSKAAVAAITRVTMSVEEFYLDNGNPPDRLEELVPEYLKSSQIKDPWGREYHYQFPGDHSDFDVFTYGADNSPGGEGADVDINSWE